MDIHIISHFKGDESSSMKAKVSRRSGREFTLGLGSRKKGEIFFELGNSLIWYAIDITTKITILFT